MWMMLATALASSMDGTWTFAGSATERAQVEAVKEEVVQRFNVLARPIVRGRLEQPMAVRQAYTLLRDGDRVEVAIDGKTIVGTLGSTKREGERVQRLTEVPGGFELYQGNEEGGKTHRFVEKAGTLHVTVSLSSPRLGDEPSWSLTYKR